MSEYPPERSDHQEQPSGPESPVARPVERPPWRPPAQPDDAAGRERPVVRDVDPLAPGDPLLQTHGARVLDPVTAVRPRGDLRRLRSTVYVADTILVPARLVGRLEGPLSEAARLYGLEPAPDELDGRRASVLAEHSPSTPAVVRVRLQPVGAPVDVDAWPVLQALRGAASRELRPLLAEVGLDHVLAGGWPSMQGGPFVPNGMAPAGPLGEYGVPGRGARAPVAYVGQPPARSPRVPGRRPVVAVLDTGVGDHPWLVDGVGRDDDIEIGGLRAGLPDSVPDPELTGDIVGPLDGMLDTHSGHGTFICGVVRQLCPDADLLAIRVMRSDGIVTEHDLVWALGVLDARLALTQDGATRDGDLDVVVLSLGYYHESPLVPEDDSTLRAVLASLARRGVAVVAAAGNDATTRPMYPAAFAPHPGGLPLPGPAGTPITSVGSLNPDGTVALFSNDGEWVRTWDTGAALVSTFPTTFAGGSSPSVRYRNAGAKHKRDRATIDPDAFLNGFGTWSGTSFAAPVFAGRLARALIADRSIDDVSPKAALARAEAALKRCLSEVER